VIKRREGRKKDKRNLVLPHPQAYQERENRKKKKRGEEEQSADPNFRGQGGAELKGRKKATVKKSASRKRLSCTKTLGDKGEYP